MSNSSLVNYTRISPNRTSPRRNKIDRITIHHMAGNLTVENCGNVFAPSSRQASSNYGIGSDGRVGMYVEEKDRAWTSSSSANDNRAVTIEVADNKIGNGWGSSNAAMAKLILLCADICRRNGISRLVYTGSTSGNLTLHKWFANTDCPGAFLESQMPTIAKEVNKLLASGATSYTWNGATAVSGSTSSSSSSASTSTNPEAKGYLMKGDTGAAVKTMQTMLIACGYSCCNSGADGSFGSATLTALKAFQKANGLEVDGFYGSKSKAALTAKYNAKKAGSTTTVSKPTSSGGITVDGSWGVATTKKAQAVFGTSQDGIISNQPSSNQKYLPNAYTGSWQFKASGYQAGSSLIRAMQRFLGITADGYFGKGSVTALQKYLKNQGLYTGSIDGSMGGGTVRAFQTWLNRR